MRQRAGRQVPTLPLFVQRNFLAKCTHLFNAKTLYVQYRSISLPIIAKLPNEQHIQLYRSSNTCVPWVSRVSWPRCWWLSDGFWTSFLFEKRISLLGWSVELLLKVGCTPVDEIRGGKTISELDVGLDLVASSMPSNEACWLTCSEILLDGSNCWEFR